MGEVEFVVEWIGECVDGGSIYWVEIEIVVEVVEGVGGVGVEVGVVVYGVFEICGEEVDVFESVKIDGGMGVMVGVGFEVVGECVDVGSGGGGGRECDGELWIDESGVGDELLVDDGFFEVGVFVVENGVGGDFVVGVGGVGNVD